MLHRAIDKAQLVIVELDLAGEKIHDAQVKGILMASQRQLLEQSKVIREARKELLKMELRSEDPVRRDSAVEEEHR